MSLRVGPAPAVPPARRRVLADDDLAALLEALPGLPLPPEQVRTWATDAPADAVDRARQEAWRRLAADGVLRGPPGDVDGVAALVDPAVLAALVLPARADLLVRCRSWAGSDAFDAHLAVAGLRGTATVRRTAVTGSAGRVGSEPSPGLELGAFAASGLLGEVLRAVPPVEGGPVDDPADDAGTAAVRVGATASAAVVAAVRDGRDDVAVGLWARAVAEGATGGAGDDLPEVLVDLALHRAGAVDLAVRRPDGAVRPAVAAWWLAAGRWWRVRTVPARSAAGRGAAGPGPDGVDLVLAPTTRSGLADDVLDLLVAGLAPGARPVPPVRVVS